MTRQSVEIKKTRCLLAKSKSKSPQKILSNHEMISSESKYTRRKKKTQQYYGWCCHITKGVFEDVNRRTIEILQRAHMFYANSSLMVHNIHLKRAASFLGHD